MVHHIIGAAEFGVFVFEDVKAVGASRNDLFYSVVIQGLNILVGHHLEEKLIAGTTGRIAGTGFFSTQDRKLHTYLVQDGGKSFSDLLGSLIKAAGAAYPEQYFGCFAAGKKFGHGSYLHVIVFSSGTKNNVCSIKLFQFYYYSALIAIVSIFAALYELEENP